MRRYDALARHERAQHADSQIKVFNLGIVSKSLAEFRFPQKTEENQKFFLPALPVKKYFSRKECAQRARE